MKRTPLRKVSTKRALELKEYSKLRKAYLVDHPYCEVWLREHATECLKTAGINGCPEATDIHHRKGRVGKMLLDTQYWLAVSREMHDNIHRNPKWAYAKGYLLLK